MNALRSLHRDYEQILQSMTPGVDQDRALSALMDRIKAEFAVPLIHNPEWERKNKSVIALYRKVSHSRTTL